MSLLPNELQERLNVVRETMARRATTVQGIEEVGFKEELRFELLYDVALGIGELAQKELQDSPRTRPPAPSASFSLGLPKLSLRALQASPRGLRSPRPPATPSAASASASAAATPRPPPPTPAGDSLGGRPRFHLPLQRSHSDGHDPTSSRGVRPPRSQARHYGLDEFRAVRAAFGTAPADYARAFPSDLSEFDPSWRQRLKESVSEGASGSFFYRVMSNEGSGVSSRFIIKQITWQEKNTLMAFLPAYRDYVLRRGGRSLIQYFGCHSMSLRWRFSGRVYFVVMRNFLPVRQWLTFDIKGATANRRALAADLLHQIHAGEDPRGGAAWGTLRDWEWMDIAMVCDISDADKAALSEMIAADAAFLSAQGLLDYSLLVGIHRVPPQASQSEHDARLRELRSAGGYISVDRQRVYFFGIIDVLEHFSLRWRAQRAVLNAAYCLACKCAAAEGISAMPPHDYADRFRTFVTREVLQIEDSVPNGVPQGASRSAMARHSGCCLACCCSGRRCGQRMLGHGSLGSANRWSQLWQRRRRGLVRERIEAERADHMRRIAELEAQVNALLAT